MSNADSFSAFDSITMEAIESFHAERDSILFVVHERLRHDSELNAALEGESVSRIADETARIFAENLYVCMKYRLPGALTEYLDWLRSYLTSRQIPRRFLSRLLQAMQMGCVSFLPSSAADHMSAVFHELRAREQHTSQEVLA